MLYYAVAKQAVFTRLYASRCFDLGASLSESRVASPDVSGNYTDRRRAVTWSRQVHGYSVIASPLVNISRQWRHAGRRMRVWWIAAFPVRRRAILAEVDTAVQGQFSDEAGISAMSWMGTSVWWDEMAGNIYTAAAAHPTRIRHSTSLFFIFNWLIWKCEQSEYHWFKKVNKRISTINCSYFAVAKMYCIQVKSVT